MNISASNGELVITEATLNLICMTPYVNTKYSELK